MKKLTALILCLILAALAFCGCSIETGKEAEKDGEKEARQETGTDDTEKEDEPEDKPLDEPKSDVDISEYKAPAELVSIDMSKEDPSNDYIKFVYDTDGKISQCYYKIGDNLVTVSYVYEDGGAELYAFIGDGILAADEEIELLSDYSPEKGFTVIKGYYFKGYDAQ